MHFGNEGRNSLLGPNFRQFDFSIYKNTNLTERLHLELRLEAYNLLNHPNFASPLYPGFLAAADFNGIATGTDAPGTACSGVAARPKLWVLSAHRDRRCWHRLSLLRWGSTEKFAGRSQIHLLGLEPKIELLCNGLHALGRPFSLSRRCTPPWQGLNAPGI